MSDIKAKKAVVISRKRFGGTPEIQDINLGNVFEKVESGHGSLPEAWGEADRRNLNDGYTKVQEVYPGAFDTETLIFYAKEIAKLNVAEKFILGESNE